MPLWHKSERAVLRLAPASAIAIVTLQITQSGTTDTGSGMGDVVRGIRIVGLMTLVAAVGSAATGVWWAGATRDRAALAQEEASLAVVTSDLSSSDILLSQAIVFALDEGAQVVESDDVVAARMAAEDALARLDAREVDDQDVQARLAAFVAGGYEIVGLLAVDDVDGARQAYASELDAIRLQFDAAAAERIGEIQERDAMVGEEVTLASVLTAAMTLVFVVGFLALIWSTWQRSRAEGAGLRSDEPPHIVIQLPTGPNTLSERRRYPKVDDLGWLIGQVIEPFEARGWDMGITCPAVGVDCDPADVREMLASLIGRAETAGAERIGIIVQTSADRVRVVVADDGEPILAPGGYLDGSDPIKLRSAVRTRAEAATAELRWSRMRDLNFATLDLPRLDRASQHAVKAGV